MDNKASVNNYNDNGKSFESLSQNLSFVPEGEINASYSSSYEDPPEELFNESLYWQMKKEELTKELIILIDKFSFVELYWNINALQQKEGRDSIVSALKNVIADKQNYLQQEEIQQRLTDKQKKYIYYAKWLIQDGKDYALSRSPIGDLALLMLIQGAERLRKVEKEVEATTRVMRWIQNLSQAEPVSNQPSADT